VVPWDPARSAPPSDSGPEAKGLSISNYESAWDKPFNPHEQKWVPPPRSPLPKGYDYTPPAPQPASYDTSSESETEEEVGTVESGGFHTSDLETPEGHKDGNKEKEKFIPVFPWEMRSRGPATRVFPGDDKGKGVTRPYDRRASLDKYDFTNAYNPFLH
jgi:hypothetical protein